MISLIELARSIRHPELKNGDVPVGEKAKELWNLLAPDRHPTPEIPMAMFAFHYNNNMRLSAMSFERQVFASILEPYWKTKDIIFEGKLYMDPNYFQGGKVDKQDKYHPSFVLHIDVPRQPSNDEYVSVFGFAEQPRNKIFNPLNKNHQQSEIVILAESRPYTGDLSRILIGKPNNLQTIRFVPIDNVMNELNMMLPHHHAWRKKFAMDIMNMSISFAHNGTLKERREDDEKWQQRFTRQTI